MSAPRAAIDVAVGVVIRGDRTVLLGQRIPGKPYAGWWEFPGGKVEPGESVAAALERELHEELGLDVRASSPWVVREFDYPHAKVRLHFRRVFDFAGEPHGREGQAFAWVRYDARIEQAPLLPATVPVIAWLRLPSLCVECSLDDGDNAADLSGAIALLDRPGADPDRFEAAFYRVRASARAQRAPLLVGDAHPRSFADCADGVVLSATGLRECAQRPRAALVAARCESAADLAHAARVGADFAIASGELARECVDRNAVPIYVRPSPEQGVTAAAVDAARRCGAHGLVRAQR